jgi:inorganic triphosphatase YgiF
LTDIDEVNDLYELLRQLAELQKLDEALYEKSWKGAVLAQPKGQMQHEWAEEWATQATRHQHWTLLSRAAITMRQLWMPNSEVWRKYTYVMITAQWLASRGTSTGQNSGEDRMMALNGTLAIRQMDDAVKAMEANQNVSDFLYNDHCNISHP